MKILFAGSEKISKYQHEINILLKAINQKDALITDESRFNHFFDHNKKDFPVKLRPAIKKVEKDYHVTIQFKDKISDVAEQMYGYKPF
jgi:hypothetical protein